MNGLRKSPLGSHSRRDCSQISCLQQSPAFAEHPPPVVDIICKQVPLMSLGAPSLCKFLSNKTRLTLPQLTQSSLSSILFCGGNVPALWSSTCSFEAKLFGPILVRQRSEDVSEDGEWKYIKDILLLS